MESSSSWASSWSISGLLFKELTSSLATTTTCTVRLPSNPPTTTAAEATIRHLLSISKWTNGSKIIRPGAYTKRNRWSLSIVSAFKPCLMCLYEKTHNLFCTLMKNCYHHLISGRKRNIYLLTMTQIFRKKISNLRITEIPSISPVFVKSRKKMCYPTRNLFLYRKKFAISFIWNIKRE